MNTYIDANLLVRIYLQLPGGNEALAMLNDREGRAAWPFPVTDLLRCEVINAIQRMVFESRQGGQWRVPLESAAVAQTDFAQDLQDAVFLKRSPLTLRDVEPEFDLLSSRHTAREGFRTYDVIHVASAKTMSCQRFLTFDLKVKHLARIEGLRIR